MVKETITIGMLWGCGSLERLKRVEYGSGDCGG